jgi:hypothetical protein
MFLFFWSFKTFSYFSFSADEFNCILEIYEKNFEKSDSKKEEKEREIEGEREKTRQDKRREKKEVK